MTQPKLLTYQHFYLMGIKGVAMTALAQLLTDAGKHVAGCDVGKEFVTQEQLNKLPVKIDDGFDHQLPAETECVVYTAAHGGPANPIVKQALNQKIPCFSHAEALSFLFNAKQGAAVCGVGGKSTVSAMLVWILEKLNYPVSYSVGVGEIIGLDQTGCWRPRGDWFVAEADEYVTDPDAAKNKQAITPRFSYFRPNLTVCTNLEYDHPDVYQDFAQTKQVFSQFFQRVKPGGILIYSADNQDLTELITTHQAHLEQKNITAISYGEADSAQMRLLSHQAKNQALSGTVASQDQKLKLELQIPGKFNLLNAMAASLAAAEIGVDLADSFQALRTFGSTKRRFELIGQKNGVVYLDDYAHHPHQITRTIKALQQWYPDTRRVIAFQPHTYSRTKQLLTEFVQALGTAQEVMLLDIFPSAREKYDPSVSSDLLKQEVEQKFPNTKIANLKTINSLADFCQHQLQPGDVLMTMGAGDVYQVHNQI